MNRLVVILLRREDLIGIPRSHNQMSFYEPLAWAVLLSCTAGICFLDEFTQINRPDVESASYQVVLDKLVGFVEFNPNVMVIAAGNSPERGVGFPLSWNTQA